jgi:GNAT superfamily N-acetyltransferase
MLEIAEVKSGRDLRAFIALPYRLYRGDPNFVPPLRLQVKELLTEKKNMQFGYGPHIMFLAKKDGEAIGRILAGIDEGFNRDNDLKSAWVALFECEHDEEAALALLSACEDWARARGMDMLRGPVSPDNGDDFKGLLVMGFDGPPALLNAYNPPWYPKLFDRYGFIKDEDLFAYYFDQQSFRESRLAKIVPYAMSKFNYRVDSVDKRNLRREVEDIQKILEETIPVLEGDWMQIPSVEDVEKEARFLLPMVDSDFICIARTCDTNRPVGFVVAIPEYNQIFKRLRNGRILPFGIFTFLRYRRRIDALRVFVQFVVPEYQNKAVNAAIFCHIFEKAREKGILSADGSTIGELNLPSRLSVEKLGGRHYRTYRTYRKKIV